MPSIKSFDATLDGVPELRYLQAFYAVCSAGGFTAAASRLECTQPAISYQVRQLERTMRTKLIERGGRRVVLTPAGEQLRGLCKSFFGELARVRSGSTRERRRQTLSLASASGFGRYVLMPALHRLRASMALELNLWFDSAEVVLNGLERGECDAAFVYTRRLSNRLRYLPVYREELALIVAPALLRRLGRLELDRLESFDRVPFVTYQEGDYVFGRWFETCLGEQPGLINSVASFSELEEVIDLVKRGEGFSIVPRDAVAVEIAARKVQVLHPNRGARCMNQVYRAVRAGSESPSELEELTRVLRALPGQE